MNGNSIEIDSDERIKKQFGDFAEHLIMFLLGAEGMSVAHIDHVGADLFATDRNGKKYAISVKGRRFKTDSPTYTFTESNIKHLTETAKKWDMNPAIAFVLINHHEEHRIIRVIIMALETMKMKGEDSEIKYINKVQHGYSIRISNDTYITQIRHDKELYYSELEFNAFNRSILL